MQYIACYHLYKIQINTYIDTEYLPKYFFEYKKKKKTDKSGCLWEEDRRTNRCGRERFFTVGIF